MAVRLISRFECRDGARGVVAGLIGAYSEHVNASPGTVRFEVYTERDNPNQFVIIECYRDEDVFKAHLADPENAVFNDKLGPLISGDASEPTFLEVP